MNIGYRCKSIIAGVMWRLCQPGSDWSSARVRRIHRLMLITLPSLPLVVVMLITLPSLPLVVVMLITLPSLPVLVVMLITLPSLPVLVVMLITLPSLPVLVVMLITLPSLPVLVAALLSAVCLQHTYDIHSLIHQHSSPIKHITCRVM